jgi:hypothetical protein
MAGSSPARTVRGSEASRKQPTNSNRYKSSNFLDKIRNMLYVFPLTESLSRAPVDGREDEKPWLFEILAHNLTREPG